MSPAHPLARPRLDSRLLPGSLPRSRLLLVALLLSVLGACGPLEDGHPPVRDYVPPVLLSAPDAGADVPDPEGARDFREAAHRLRAQLQRFVDTVSSGPGSYPAARCCAGELSHLLRQAQRWEGGSRMEEGVVPVLIRLAMEPGMDVAPLLADSVVARARGQSMPVPRR
jgi:hypothetical protein